MKKGQLIIGSGKESADIRYASGFHAPDPFIFYSAQGEKAIIVNSLEFGRAVKERRENVKVYNQAEFLPKNQNSGKIEDIVVELTKKLKIDSWTVPSYFPLFYAEFLGKRNIKVICCEDDFFPRRRRKNKNEVNEIKKALKMTSKAMKRAYTVIAESTVSKKNELLWNGEFLTSEILRAEIEVEILRNNGLPADTIAACGSQAADPHEHGSGKILAGKVIIVDIFPRLASSGYFGDMTRTFLKGKASSKIIKAYEAVKKARDKAKNMIRDGVASCDVYRKAMRVLEQEGFKSGRKKDGTPFGFIHGLGHGLGLDIHEAPRISPLVDAPLKKGDVVSVEPGVYYPEWGGVRLEDIVYVDKDTCECLNDFPDNLEID